MGRVSVHHMAPSQPRRDPVESLFMHCDLAADAHVVGNVRNCFLWAVPAESRVLRSSAIGLAARALDRVPARPHGHNRWSRPEGAISRRDLRSQATAQTARGLLSALRHKHGGSDIIMVATTITLFVGAQYQRGHGLGSIFKGLFRSAIPLLKGPVLRAGVRMASDVPQRKNHETGPQELRGPLGR